MGRQRAVITTSDTNDGSGGGGGGGSSTEGAVPSTTSSSKGQGIPEATDVVSSMLRNIMRANAGTEKE